MDFNDVYKKVEGRYVFDDRIRFIGTRVRK